MTGDEMAESVKVSSSGTGRRANFTASFEFTCSCSKVNKINALGLIDEANVTCKECGGDILIEGSTIDGIRDELICQIEAELDAIGVELSDQDYDDEVPEFIATHGRFPKREELRPPPSERSARPCVSLVGESRYQDTIELCTINDSVTLVHEPFNTHDKRAIVVEWLPGQPIGYIPRGTWVHELLLDKSSSYKAHIDYIGRSDGGAKGVVIKVLVRGATEKITVRSQAESRRFAGQANKSGCALAGLALMLPIALVVSGVV